MIRDQDTVARVGGDEFCVLAPETDGPGAEHLTGRVESAVARVAAGLDALGASAGAAVFPHDGTTAAALFEAADQRLLASSATRARPAAARRRHAAERPATTPRDNARATPRANRPRHRRQPPRA